MKDKLKTEPPRGNGKEPEIVLSLYDLNGLFSYMVGRLKTIIDASSSDTEIGGMKNKALKDLISQEVWSNFDHILSMSGFPTRLGKQEVKIQ